ncbi:nvj1p [Saccharomyces arboricola H-6]|uniref:Nvj1p n=1 Tax=Saccharomyces arboricola (strain H-6 / AS 2.3317 / CBS 10644) TaxID=1160507 RepID=J8LMP3_SACAR|nr:nvj1p [Saccharomyces arboricola H-6]
MTRPPVVHGAFALGLSMAVFKGVEKTVREHLEKQGWIEPQKVDYELIFTIEKLKNLVDEKYSQAVEHCDDTSELSWRKVLNFISRQSSELDTRIYVLILLLSVLLPIAWTVLDGDREGTPDDNSNDVDENLIASAKQLKHYNDGERAVLQFGKNRSEPIILSYRDMNVSDGDHRDFTTKRELEHSHLTSKSENALAEMNDEDTPGDQQEQPLEIDIECEKNEPGEETKNVNKEKDHSSSSEVESHNEAKKETVADPEILSQDTRTTSSLKSSTSFPISFRGSIDLKSINHPSSLHLQVSPTKSTNLDAQVNTEQAYSQPFRY